jgi:secondary thiamine-phosphate synthase enzyme
MAWFQKTVTLAPRPRGVHLITDELERAVPEIARLRVGVAHVFIQHTSASLCINENADPTVRTDLEAHFNLLAPENAPHYRHTTEGPDDMPAHVKAALIGNSLSIPITDGRLNLGTWQGICLCEHRNRGGARRVVVTLEGEAN